MVERIYDVLVGEYTQEVDRAVTFARAEQALRRLPLGAGYYVAARRP